jgi:hypothetical protein
MRFTVLFSLYLTGENNRLAANLQLKIQGKYAYG